MKVVDELKNDMTATALLADWLGATGIPVHQMVADFRANRCIYGDNGEPCPCNVEPNWWDRVKSKIADWIKGELEVKNNMNLKAAEEDKLMMCSACGCCLKLKVWTPTIHLKNHIDRKVLDKTPDYCWMKKELLP